MDPRRSLPSSVRCANHGRCRIEPACAPGGVSVARTGFSRGSVWLAQVRAWHSYGGFDSNSISVIQNAQAEGLSAGVYLFPCPTQDATSQVHQMVASLQQGGISTNGLQVWMDIETNPSSGCGWPSDQSSNCAYIASLVSAAQGLGVSPGVYASAYMWGSIAGSGCTSCSGVPLWYADYDGVDSCSDFSSFGGWSSAAVHQWDDNGNMCGVGYDKNVQC